MLLLLPPQAGSTILLASALKHTPRATITHPRMLVKVLPRNPHPHDLLLAQKATWNLAIEGALQ